MDWSELNEYGFVNQLLNASRYALNTLELLADVGSDFPATEINQITYLETLRAYTTAAASISYNFAYMNNLRTVNLTLKNPTPFTVDPLGSTFWFYNSVASLKTLIIREAITADLSLLPRFIGLIEFEVWGGATSNWTTVRVPRELLTLTLANIPHSCTLAISPAESYAILKKVRLYFFDETANNKTLQLAWLPTSVSDLTIVGYGNSTLTWLNSDSSVPYGLTYLNLTGLYMAGDGLPDALSNSASYITRAEIRLLHTAANPLPGYFPYWSSGYLEELIIDGFGWGPVRFNNDFCTLINGAYNWLETLKIYDTTLSGINETPPSCITLLYSLEELYVDRAPITYADYLPNYITHLHIDHPTSPTGSPPVTAADFEEMTGIYRDIIHYLGVYQTYLIDLRITNGYENVSLPLPAFQLQGIKGLWVLDLSNNNISGTFPAYFLDHLNAMEVINVDNNKMTGTFPWIGYNWLSEIHARDNNFTSWPTPTSSQRFNSADFANNHYLTVIPNSAWWSSIPDLRSIDFSGTERLIGPFPGAIYNPDSPLTSYIADGSGLGGPLPTIHNYNLKVLSLKGSKACGQIPDFGASIIPTLARLDLSNTQVSGTLPASYGKFWDYLDLSSTQIEGAAVPFYFHPTHPTHLNISRNPQLTGDLFKLDGAGKSWFPPRVTNVILDGTNFEFCALPPNINSPFNCSVASDTTVCFTCPGSWSACMVSSCAKRSSPFEASGSRDFAISELSKGSFLTRQAFTCAPLEDFPATPSYPVEELAPSVLNPITPPSSSPGVITPVYEPNDPEMCFSRRPAPTAVCVGPNSWRISSDLSVTELVIAKGTQVHITGNLTIFGTLTFDGIDGTLIVGGCTRIVPLETDPDWMADIVVSQDMFDAFGSTTRSRVLGEQRTGLSYCEAPAELVTNPSAIRFRIKGVEKSGMYKMEVATVTEPHYVGEWRVVVRRNNTKLVALLAGTITFGIIFLIFTLMCVYYRVRY